MKELKGYNKCEFVIPHLSREFTDNGKIKLLEFEMNYFVNGNKTFSFQDKPNIDISLAEPGYSVIKSFKLKEIFIK